MELPDRRIFISLGSNLGDRLSMLSKASSAIERSIGPLVHRSSIFETDPAEVLDQPAFLNQVVEVSSGLVPAALITECLRIEAELGRVRLAPKGPRTIDLDLLYCGRLLVHLEGEIDLDLPHPSATSRRFVLEPLAEIAPSFADPLSGRTIASLLRDLPLDPRVAPWKSGPSADRVPDA